MSAGDVVVLAIVVAAFAVLATAHLAIAAGLAARTSWRRALIGLVVAPLAPYYAARARMWTRALVWCGALVVYVIGRVLAAG